MQELREGNVHMEEKRGPRFCGTSFSIAELELIGNHRRLRRTQPHQLANTICELLDWRRPNGSLKAQECRLFLEELESKAILRLPVSRGNGRGSPRSARRAFHEGRHVLPAILTGKLCELRPVTLELVKTRQQQSQWREWVDRHHYLGCKIPFGAHLRYFVHTTRPQPQRVAVFRSAAPHGGWRRENQWIGWDDAQRLRAFSA